MKAALKDGCYLKRLEDPHIYDTAFDELYLLDEESFQRVLALGEGRPDPGAAALLGQEGLLQERPRSSPVLIEGRAADPSLRYLEIQITGRCDKACRHCYLGASREEDMDPDLYEDTLRQFSRIQGLKVMISGGEPSCHPRFREMARLLPSFPLRSVLVTHGEWIGPEEALWLKDHFHQVQVSLDGLEPGHEALRGRGSFSRVLGGIRELGKAGVPLSLATMVHEGNLDQFETLSDLVSDLGAGEWEIDVPCPAGRWEGRIPPVSELRTMSEKLRFAFGGSFHGGASGLACGSHLMTVGPDGTAAKCGFYMDKPAGNVFSEGLGDVWKRVRHLPLAELDCDCEQLTECAGGCRYRARILEGSDLSLDPVQCLARGVR